MVGNQSRDGRYCSLRPLTYGLWLHMVGSCTVQLSQSVLCPRYSTSPQILIKSRQRAALSAVENSGSSTRREERGGTFILFIALYRAKYLDLFSLAHYSLSLFPKEACAVHVRAYTHSIQSAVH